MVVEEDVHPAGRIGILQIGFHEPLEQPLCRLGVLRALQAHPVSLRLVAARDRIRERRESQVAGR